MADATLDRVLDVISVALHPQRAFVERVASRPRRAAAGIVLASGLLAGGISAVSTAIEPIAAADRSAGYAFSITLPVLFVAFWVIDATIVDAVAQLMGAPSRLRAWTAASAHAIPFLLVFELIRLGQALLDRAGAVDVSTGVGFVEFAVIAWFVWMLSNGVRALYDLPMFSAISAALAPGAAMMTVLLVLLLVATGLHIAGAG